MFIILLEALLALSLLVLIVWWTMFSGRRDGELPDPPTGKTPALPPRAQAPVGGDNTPPSKPPP